MNYLKMIILTMIVSLSPALLMGQIVKQSHSNPLRTEQDQQFWKSFRWIRTADQYEKTSSFEGLNEAEYFLWNGEVWTPVTLYNITFSDGKVSEIESYYYDVMGYRINMRITFSYTNGLLTEEVLETANFMTQQLENNERTLYSYGESGGKTVLTEVTDEQWSGQWEPYFRETYSFDNGVISSGISYEYVVDTFEERYLFTVTESNDTTFITSSVRDADAWVLDERELFPGLTATALFDYFTGFGLENYTLMFAMSTLTMDYPDYIFQSYAGGNWINQEAQSSSRTYASEGDPSTLIMLQKDLQYWDDAWITEEIEEIYFNQKVNPDSSLFKIMDESSFRTAYREIYEYDENDRLTVLTSWFDAGSGLVNYFRYELRYGSSTSVEDPGSEITEYVLEPAYPNPFNPYTTIRYQLGEAGDISIRVYDIVGREVAELYNGMQNSGRHSLQFNASDLSSGTYFIVMQGSGYYRVNGVTLIK